MATPERLLPHRTTVDGWNVLRIHYSAVPGYSLEEATEGMDHDEIQREFEIDWLSVSGVKIYRRFNEAVHVARDPLKFDPRETLHCGYDPGLCPAFCVTQLNSYGQWRVLSALAPPEGSGLGTYEFGEMMAEHLYRTYAVPHGWSLSTLNKRVKMFSDPAIGQPPHKAEHEKVDDAPRTHMQILLQGIDIMVGRDERGNPVYEHKPGWDWDIQPGAKEIVTRIETMRARMGLLLDNGLPAFVVCPTCTDVVSALSGYHYRVRPDGRQELDPFKDWHSHLSDSLSYVATMLFVQSEYEEEGTYQPHVRSMAANRRRR